MLAMGLNSAGAFVWLDLAGMMNVVVLQVSSASPENNA
jgi:hypothetical protein